MSKKKAEKKREKEIAKIKALCEKYSVTERITDQKIASATLIGTREYQQDSLAVPSDEIMNLYISNICVLSDGMGGLEGGEKASKICTDTVITDFYMGGNQLKPSEFLKQEIKKVDELVSDLHDENGKLLDAGATFVATIFENEKLFWASVGDSRIYLIRDETIIAFNEDHNYYKKLKELVKKGEITQSMADNDKEKEALISYIGINGVELIDINEEPFIMQDGDIILLCSDGLYKSLSDYSIWFIVNKFKNNIPTAAKMLTYTAVDTRPLGQDNTTVILVKYNNKK